MFRSLRWWGVLAFGLAGLFACGGGGEGAAEQPGLERRIPEPAELEGFHPEVRAAVEQRLGALRAAAADPERWADLGKVYAAHHLDDLAREALTVAVELSHGEPRWWYLRGICEARASQYEAALASMERAAALAPGAAPPRWRLALWALELDELERAELELERARALDAEHPAVVLATAQLALARGEPDRALEALEGSPVLEGPNEPYARKWLGAAYRRLGRDGEARANLERSGGARPVYPDPWMAEVARYRAGSAARVREARLLVARGDAEAAVALLERARELDPTDTSVLSNLGAAHAKAGRPALAVALLREVARLEPAQADSHLNLAWALASAGELEGALASATQARELAPKSARIEAARARFLAELGRADEAFAAWRRAVELGQREPALAVAVGRAQLDAYRVEEALSCFERASREGPALPDAWIGLGIALEALGRPAEAAVAARRALELEPGAAIALELLAHLGEARRSEGAGGAEGAPERAEAAGDGEIAGPEDIARGEPVDGGDGR